MKIDTTLLVSDLSQMPALTRAAEALGFDGIWVSETAHEPFMPLALAAEHSQHLTLGTSIAVAFPRTPAVLAHIGWDLARFSKGRFIMGLGTQVKAHNERRLGVKWERPVARLREVIQATRAFWDCWQNGTKLNFRGEFFKLTLMTPFFNPGPHDYADIPIHIAGVNKKMCQLAGELADGLQVHPLHTRRYLQEIVWPNLKVGLEKSGRRLEDIELSSGVFVIPTDDAQEAKRIEAQARQQIAFYASTPSYKTVLAVHGWDEVADKLRALAGRGKWDQMPGLISDEMLETFAVRGRWAELPDKLQKKYDGLLHRLSYYFPFVPGQNDAGWQATVAGFKN